ncbi:MAG: N-6 DNA methylase [Bacteroidia bacterium]
MTSKEKAYNELAALIERFEEQYHSYKKADYNETQTRRDFIDPFFKALGWDVDNENGSAESYREVMHESRIRIGKTSKAPDYSFRLSGGKLLFFVEAKKPSVVIKDDIIPAYQVRKYGWNLSLAISIVTDFEEFAVYDCTKKPKPDDRAAVARIKYLTFRDYLNEFDFLWNTFSREQVLKGGLDKYIESSVNKKGTTTVDKDFLQSLDNWRTYLATSISWNNKNLDEDEINFVVQQTIDRIIFLRIAEDREIEPEENLRHCIKQGNFYQNLFNAFTVADEKYNSGLFDFKKDKISKDLMIDNKVIKTIISELYSPSPYAFDVMPVEILGTAYEQFLGKQIKIDKAHRAHIEEKPEVRKAGGVYYTPQYVVEYIVKNTVGKLIENKTPKEINKIKIVDPACGSGSFLIGAYKYLLDWHRNYYHVRNSELSNRHAELTSRHAELVSASESSQIPKQVRNDGKFLTPEGNLTTAEKKRILLNNIYGVDIDVNAVEVTKLSLLLKCMEGETRASIDNQMRLFNDKVLPTLDNNIKDGNSLVDTDFYPEELFVSERKVKPFNWQQAFPEVFNLKKPATNQDFKKQFNKVANLEKVTNDLLNKYIAKEPAQEYFKTHGFDIVIGNPPYGALFSTEEITYFKKRYNTSVWRSESYLLFIEQGVKLLNSDGLIGFIIPDTLLNLGFTQPAREMLLRNSRLQEIVGLPSNVFSGATVDTIILLSEKTNYSNTFHSSNVLVKSFGKKQFISTIENSPKEFYINTKDWFEENAFNLQTDNSEKILITKIEAEKKSIADIAKMYSGIKVYEVGKGKPAQTERIRNTKPYTSKAQIDKSWFPFYDGKHIGKYERFWKDNNWIKYGEWLAAPRNPENFEGEKILIRKITGKTLLASYIHETSYCNTLLFVLKLKESSYSYKSILAILNSDLIGWYFRKKFQISDDDTFPQIMIRDILQFPIPAISKNEDVELNKFVDLLLKLKEEIGVTKLQTKIEELQRKTTYYEEQINKKVNELYGLMPDEMKL